MNLNTDRNEKDYMNSEESDYIRIGNDLSFEDSDSDSMKERDKWFGPKHASIQSNNFSQDRLNQQMIEVAKFSESSINDLGGSRLSKF